MNDKVLELLGTGSSLVLMPILVVMFGLAVAAKKRYGEAFAFDLGKRGALLPPVAEANGFRSKISLRCDLARAIASGRRGEIGRHAILRG